MMNVLVTMKSNSLIRKEKDLIQYSKQINGIIIMLAKMNSSKEKKMLINQLPLKNGGLITKIFIKAFPVGNPLTLDYFA